MYIDEIVITSLVTVGAVISCTAGIWLFVYLDSVKTKEENTDGKAPPHSKH